MSIRVAIAGVGNCASSLVQGVEYYKDTKDEDKIPGLMHNNFGGDDLHNPLGSGNIPMRETIEYIIRKSPDATFTIENMTAAPSVVWLVENGFLSK